MSESGASLASTFAGQLLGKPPTDHVFAITTPDRVMKLAFDTADMRDRWYQALGEYHTGGDTTRAFYAS